jgi:hypothetical protein
MGRETSTGDPRGTERVARGDGEVRSSVKASNDRGAKGPQFKGNVGSNKRIVIGPRPSNLMTPEQIQKTFNGLSEGEACLHRVQECWDPCPKAGCFMWPSYLCGIGFLTPVLRGQRCDGAPHN